MLSDVNDSDNSSKASMEQEFAKVREEMIRRDQLLESQIVDAHAQLQKEAQAIVSPTKTHITSLQNQVSWWQICWFGHALVHSSYAELSFPHTRRLHH